MGRRSNIFLHTLACSIFLISSSAHSQVHARVINGSNTKAGAWPFMVALIAAKAPPSADGQFRG
jgi:secreted trypsin-like serine protease